MTQGLGADVVVLKVDADQNHTLMAAWNPWTRDPAPE